jgi:hypothetical protein
MRLTLVYAVNSAKAVTDVMLTPQTAYALRHERQGLQFLSVRDTKFRRSGLLN